MAWIPRRPIAGFLSVVVLFAVACTPAAAPGTPQSTTRPKGEQPVVKASPAAQSGAPETPDLKIGSLPIAPLTPLYVAQQLGYFKDAGFRSVELVQLGSGAESISVVASGNVHLAQTTYVSTFQAREQGFDVVIVANLDNATDGRLRNGRKDVGALVVKSDSPIQRPKELEGKRVGVSSIPGILWMFVAQTIRQDGGDYTKVNFQEVPFPQMGDVLLNGGIDAGALLEPFTTTTLDTGNARPIAFPYVDVLPSANLGGLLGRADWVKANPNSAKQFTRALQRAMDLLQDDTEARRWIIEYTKMNPDLANKMWLSVWNTQVDLKSVEAQRDIMLELGMLKERIHPADLFWSTALAP